MSEESSGGSCFKLPGSAQCITRLYKECCPGLSRGVCVSLLNKEIANYASLPRDFLQMGKKEQGVIVMDSNNPPSAHEELMKKIYTQIVQMERAGGLPR